MLDSDKTASFTMRLPRAKYDFLKQLAENNMRSLSKQIEFMLDQYIQTTYTEVPDKKNS